MSGNLSKIERPVTLEAMSPEQLADTGRMLDAYQEKIESMSGICATMRGLVFVTAKEKLGHGKFLPWLTKHFDKTRKTAAEDMRIGREFSKCNPTLHFGDLVKALAEKSSEPEIDTSHPLVSEVARWVASRNRGQLLLDFPATSRGGDTSKSRAAKPVKKSREEILREEAQIFYLPLQQKLFEALQAKGKKRLLVLPVTAPHKQASLSVLRDVHRAVGDLIDAALQQKGGNS